MPRHQIHAFNTGYDLVNAPLFNQRLAGLDGSRRAGAGNNCVRAKARLALEVVRFVWFSAGWSGIIEAIQPCLVWRWNRMPLVYRARDRVSGNVWPLVERLRIQPISGRMKIWKLYSRK